MAKQYYVYIMASPTYTLYTGVTGNLERRVSQHKQKLAKGFTRTYNVTRLVFAEAADDPQTAIKREKQIKGWVRRKKIALIEQGNPEWNDLAEEWFGNDSRDGYVAVDVRERDSSLRSE